MLIISLKTDKLIDKCPLYYYMKLSVVGFEKSIYSKFNKLIKIQIKAFNLTTLDKILYSPCPVQKQPSFSLIVASRRNHGSPLLSGFGLFGFGVDHLVPYNIINCMYIMYNKQQG